MPVPPFRRRSLRRAAAATALASPIARPRRGIDTGADLREQIALYAAEPKQIAVLRPGTDPRRHAGRVTVDVLS